MVSWSAVIRIFSEKYDEVFGNAGRKAYFDFNRVKSKTMNVTDNIIDVCKLLFDDFIRYCCLSYE